MQGVLTVALFASLLAAFWLLFVGEGESPSPAALAADALKRRLAGFFAAGGREELLAIAGRTVGDAVRTGLLAGAGLGLVGGLLGGLLAGLWGALAAPAFFLAGVALARLAAENEYRRWRDRAVAGLPDLVSFVPAFLEVSAVTPREALTHAADFISEPLRSEIVGMLGPLKRRGDVEGAFERLKSRVRHPLCDAVATRLAAAWDARVTPDMFADLADQVRDAVELAAARATAAKAGLLALVCVLGMAGTMLVFGWPGVQYLLTRLGEGFM
ncbi:MAG: hypothetical protein ACPLRW_13540 [Moorellales bacterium]